MAKKLMTAEDKEEYLKIEGIKLIESKIPAEYKDKFKMAKTLALADDKRKAIEGFIPDEYKDEYRTSLEVYDKAVELKQKKDEI